MKQQIIIVCVALLGFSSLSWAKLSFEDEARESKRYCTMGEFLLSDDAKKMTVKEFLQKADPELSFEGLSPAPVIQKGEGACSQPIKNFLGRGSECQVCRSENNYNHSKTSIIKHHKGILDQITSESQKVPGVLCASHIPNCKKRKFSNQCLKFAYIHTSSNCPQGYLATRGQERWEKFAKPEEKESYKNVVQDAKISIKLRDALDLNCGFGERLRKYQLSSSGHRRRFIGYNSFDLNQPVAEGFGSRGSFSNLKSRLRFECDKLDMKKVRLNQPQQEPETSI